MYIYIYMYMDNFGHTQMEVLIRSVVSWELSHRFFRRPWNEASRGTRGECSGYLQGGGLAVQRLAEMENPLCFWPFWRVDIGILENPATSFSMFFFCVEWVAAWWFEGIIKPFFRSWSRGIERNCHETEGHPSPHLRRCVLPRFWLFHLGA